MLGSSSQFSFFNGPGLKYKKPEDSVKYHHNSSSLDLQFHLIWICNSIKQNRKEKKINKQVLQVFHIFI